MIFVEEISVSLPFQKHIIECFKLCSRDQIVEISAQILVHSISKDPKALQNALTYIHPLVLKRAIELVGNDPRHTALKIVFQTTLLDKEPAPIFVSGSSGILDSQSQSRFGDLNLNFYLECQKRKIGKVDQEEM